MTSAENKKFSKLKEVAGVGYKKYDNFDAIEVPYVDAIPSDNTGVMGVPKSFMERYSPEQFEIVGTSQGWFGAASKTYPKQTQVSKDGSKSLVTKLNDAPAIKVSKPSAGETYYIVGGHYFKAVFARILIKHRSPSS